jgi:hypothetical protein
MHETMTVGLYIVELVIELADINVLMKKGKVTW